MKISVVIPVYNEQGRLEKILDQLNNFYEVIVIDDSGKQKLSSYINIDNFINLNIVNNKKNIGYLESIKKGIAKASGDIIVTMDGDGEHKPQDIEKLVSKIVVDNCDIVFGKRPMIARESEIFLLWLAKLLTGEKVQDSGTGFRAIKSQFAKQFHFYGSCTCGTLLQECHALKMRICEVAVDLPVVDKPRKIAWSHFMQFFSIWGIFCKLNVKGLDK